MESNLRREALPIQGHDAAVTSLAFLPNGSRLATAGADRSLKIWDPASWRELLTLHLEASVSAMSFSPTGKRLALASAGSLAFLDAEKEAVRSEQRRVDREARSRVKPMIAKIMDQTKDLLQAHDEVVSDASLAKEGNAALREFEAALYARWQTAYDVEELKLLLMPQVGRHALREQMTQMQSQRGSLERLLRQMEASGDAPRRQALTEFIPAYFSFGGIDLNEHAWEIVLDPEAAHPPITRWPTSAWSPCSRGLRKMERP